MPHMSRSFAAQLWVLVLAQVALGLLLPTLVYPDTSSYAAFAIYRAPGYGLVLDGARLLAGDHWPRAIALFQGLMSGLAVRHLVRALHDRLRVPAGVALLLGAVLTLPQLTWIPSLLTESLCHSLFLCTFAELVLALGDRPLRHFATVALAVVALIVLRPHYLFLAPVLLLPALAVAQRRRSARLALQLTVLFGGAVVVANGAQILGNWVVSGIPSRTTSLGMHAAAVQFYLATPDELAIFTDPADRAQVEPLRDLMVRRQLFQTSVPNLTDTVDGFNLVYDGIIYEGLLPQARQRLGRADLSAADWVIFDKTTARFARTLALHHPQVFARHIVGQLRSAGAMLMLMTGAALLGAWLWARRRSAEGLLIATVAAMALANHLELALVQLNRMRYVMTTDLTLVIVLLALVVRDVARAQPPPP